MNLNLSNCCMVQSISSINHTGIIINSHRIQMNVSWKFTSSTFCNTKVFAFLRFPFFLYSSILSLKIRLLRCCMILHFSQNTIPNAILDLPCFSYNGKLQYLSPIDFIPNFFVAAFLIITFPCAEESGSSNTWIYQFYSRIYGIWVQFLWSPAIPIAFKMPSIKGGRETRRSFLPSFFSRTDDVRVTKTPFFLSFFLTMTKFEFRPDRAAP